MWFSFGILNMKCLQGNEFNIFCKIESVRRSSTNKISTYKIIKRRDCLKAICFSQFIQIISNSLPIETASRIESDVPQAA